MDTFVERLLHPRRFADDQRGQISFLMVLAMFALTPLIGLVMNVSNVIHTKTRLQEVADAAAYASTGAGARSLNFIANGNIAIFELTAWIVVVDALKPALERAQISLIAQEVASNAMKLTPDPTGITLAVATAWNLKVLQEKFVVKGLKKVQKGLKVTRTAAVTARTTVAGAQKVVRKGMSVIMNAAGVAGGLAAAQGMKQPVIALPVALRVPPVHPAIPIEEVDMEHFEGENSEFMGTDVADPGQPSSEDLQEEREDEAEELKNAQIQAKYSALLKANGMEDDTWNFSSTSHDEIMFLIVDTKNEELREQAEEEVEAMSDEEKRVLADAMLDDEESGQGTQSAPGGRPSQEYDEIYEPVLIFLVATTTLSGSGGFLAHEANKRIKDQFKGKASGTNPKTPKPPKVLALEENEVDQDYADKYFRHTWIAAAPSPDLALPGVFTRQVPLLGRSLEPPFDALPIGAFALSEALIFNIESWDLVTPRWEAALVPVEKLPFDLLPISTPFEIHH